MQSGAILPSYRATTPDAIASDELARAAIEARSVLEAAAFAAAEAAEQALAVAAALDVALAQLEVPEDHDCDQDQDHAAALARSSHEAAALAPLRALSPREHEVLALVARGFTNKNIAEMLYVSPNTVKTHVASLLHKLDAETRAQLAAIATRQQQHQHRPGQRAANEPVSG